jgi:hypothetical protein
MAKQDIVKLGDTVYVHDYHRRDRDAHGKLIVENQYVPTRIVSETRLSWILEGGYRAGERKIPKGEQHGLVRKLPCGQYSPYSVYMTAEAKDDSLWLGAHAHRVVGAVENIRDVKLLKQVAALIGYDETKER